MNFKPMYCVFELKLGKILRKLEREMENSKF